MIYDILRPVLARIWKKLRERRLKGAVEALFARFRTTLYSEDVLIVLLKDLSEVTPVKRPTGIVFEDLGREHLPLLAQLNRERGAPQIDARFAAYLDAGFHGFIALRDGAAVGYYWWVDEAEAAIFPDLSELKLAIEIGPGDVYGSDFYILAAHRNGRLAGEMLARIEGGLRERGYARLWGYVAADNRPARWLYETRGYERLWARTLKQRLFMTRVSYSPDPKTYKGGADADHQ